MASTRGKGPVGNSKRVERDALVQSWEGRADLATIGLYMESKGYRVKHLSDILHFSIETVRELVLRAGSEFVNTAEATLFLEDRTGVNLNPKDKGRKNLVSNLITESDIDLTPVAEVPTCRPSINVKETTLDVIKKMAKEQIYGNEESALLISREEKDSILAQDESDALASLTKVNPNDLSEGVDNLG